MIYVATLELAAAILTDARSIYSIRGMQFGVVQCAVFVRQLIVGSQAIRRR
jgi:hypothetical protein